MQWRHISARKRLSAIAALLSTVLVTAGVSAELNLAGSEWGFADEVGKSARFIQFGDERVSGHLGCNRFTGGYSHKDGELKIGPLASTMMACPPEFMKKERELARILENARVAEPSAAKLVLKDADGKVLAELVRRDPD